MIDAIGSDHCAYVLDEKVTSDPWRILPGITGVQFALPVILHEAIQRGVSLTAVARAFSTKPAQAFGLYPRKGAIRPGADADLVLVDLGSEITARWQDMYSRCPGTAFEGRTYQARVRRTTVRGRTVYVDEGAPDILVAPGFGTFLNGAEIRQQRATAGKVALAP
jgi:dihydroorotase-like cyclic amidohydrolase